MSSIQYKRVLLKLSGEALLGEGDCGIDPDLLVRLAQELSQLRNDGVELGMVIGGGNLFRGARLAERGMDRVTGDHMGMLATVMNALAMRDTLDRMQVPCRVMSAIPMQVICEGYNPILARSYLADGEVVIFAAGTGNPFFTTDTAASLRAIEIQADVVVKATKVDGIYTADPMLDTQATLYKKLTYQQAIDQDLKVMDTTAMVLCRDHQMPLGVLNMGEPGNLGRFVRGESVGTLVEARN